MFDDVIKSVLHLITNSTLYSSQSFFILMFNLLVRLTVKYV